MISSQQHSSFYGSNYVAVSVCTLIPVETLSKQKLEETLQPFIIIDSEHTVQSSEPKKGQQLVLSVFTSETGVRSLQHIPVHLFLPPFPFSLQESAEKRARYYCSTLNTVSLV